VFLAKILTKSRFFGVFISEREKRRNGTAKNVSFAKEILRLPYRRIKYKNTGGKKDGK